MDNSFNIEVLDQEQTDNFSNGNLLVKQSHLLNSASYKLSSLSMDLIFVMISELKKDDKEFSIFNLTIKEIEKKINKRINIKSLPYAIRDVYQNPFSLSSKDDKSFIMIPWVSMFAYNDKTKTITFKFDQQMKSFLLELSDKFVLSHIREISALNSEYAKRIFNILKQWESIGRYTVNIEYLKDILKTPKSLDLYSNFKQKVLIQSCKQINEKTNLDVKMKEIKSNKKVISVMFEISSKNNIKLENNINSNNENINFKNQNPTNEEQNIYSFLNNWSKE